ncbi:hypothetical protein EXIGLDRAFT_396403 [Exidia glandulosa HHB12029]|uniref:L-Fucosyltransferase n=1 Tax=Exidia glandulosa HHB12029 TaxID=1314781 RepID=A0A165KUU8_EXIGL|nr:hypothetical protein EXIGLDRAFT_396403 [Exidia glandulosa HHB12029]
MLDGGVGLAADLAYMAQIAGLARERNRTFFVMDKWWNRGRWEDYFEDVHKTQLGPEPGCLPPPPEEYVACPRIARHWIIGSRTAKFHMSHEFMDAFEDPFKMDLERQRPMFDRALDSLRDTIRPNAALRALIAKARRSVSDVAYAGVHLRRGDQLARTWKYRKGYVPISEFVTGIRGVEGGVSAVWAASDAPGAITELGEELGHNVQVLNLTSVGGDVGRLMPAAEDAGYVQKEWRYRTEEERKRLTRGAVVDFAMISGLWLENGQRAPSASVCTYGCVLEGFPADSIRN